MLIAIGFVSSIHAMGSRARHGVWPLLRVRLPSAGRSGQASGSTALPMIALKAFSVWMLILACAVINGAFREGFLVPRLGAVAAYCVSGLVLSACIVAVSALLLPWFGRLKRSHCLWLGLFWLSLTVTFEFGVGRLLQHKTWEQLLDAYTFRGGNLWPLVLVVTALAPWWAARLRGMLRGAGK